MRHMLGGSWTIGGARPKAILRDDRPGAVPGLSLIAKFGSRHDTLARNRLEYASLRMARDMGFRVPDHFLVESDRLSLAGSHAQMLQGSLPADATLVLERFDREVLHLTADSGSSSGSLP
ncbi:HipA domain-containing protein, partial [Arthrospira platensis SPKY1]|nr:HipA domain-containing protein [Arthrospira platensis SPKY1]